MCSGTDRRQPQITARRVREEVTAVGGATETVIADTIRDTPIATRLDIHHLVVDMVARARDMEVGMDMGMEEVEAMDRTPARTIAPTTATVVSAAADRRAKARRSSM